MSDPTVAPRRRYGLWIVLALNTLLLFVLIIGWGAYRVVSALSDLPDRIVLEVDDEAITDFFHTMVAVTLEDGDSEAKIQLLTQMRSGETADPAYRKWIQENFFDQVKELAGSEDEAVSAAATALLDDLKPTALELSVPKC